MLLFLERVQHLRIARLLVRTFAFLGGQHVSHVHGVVVLVEHVRYLINQLFVLRLLRPKWLCLLLLHFDWGVGEIARGLR